MTPRAARLAVALVALLALLAGLDNLDRPLANPDEGRYAEISREMVATGDWITPRLNGIKYFEKPPLQYWAGAVSLAALGDTEVAARLYTFLAGALTLAAVAFTAARLGGAAQGVATAIALVGCPYFLALAGIVTLDMGLTLWTTAGLCAWMLSEAEPGPRPRRRWMLAAWAATALAVLSKGLVGMVLPAAAVFIACLGRRDFSPLARLEWLRGGALFFAIAAPWFIAVSLANPEFARFFFVHEHFERFLTTVHRRTEPWWFFLPVVAAGMLPWLFALPAALGHAWRSEDLGRGVGPMRVALTFSAFTIVFFSLSGSKLPTYVLPAFPPLALVLGRYLAQAQPAQLARRLWPAAALALLLLAAAWNLPFGGREEWLRALQLEARPWAIAAAAAFLASALAAPTLLLAGKRWAAVAAIGLGSVAMVWCLGRGYEVFSPRQSGFVVAQKMRPLLTPGTRLYTVATFDYTVPFYIGRTFILVRYVDEFETGLKTQPERHMSREAFEHAWRLPGEALAIMHPEHFDELRARGLPMIPVHRDPRRILVRKP